MWTINGTYDDLSFTLHDVDYLLVDGPPHDDLVHGDCKQTYTASSFGNLWDVIFGDGWQAFHIRGDGDGGVEDISIQVVGGTDIFSDVGDVINPVSRNFNNTTWASVKALFK